MRVSSNQQLEADGDLSVQRQLVREYVEKHPDWRLDEKEYFEGSKSGYKNTVEERDVLGEALLDAQKGEYQILAVYKDDRIGRRMWEIGSYVMRLKSYGVDIYTVKDGCISPDQEDIMGQMMLALRYGNAQKSSSDTGMRVKDTARKLVEKGKFMGGAAPYGYRLVLSGEISKHGRALHHLEILPDQAEMVRHIFRLSLYKEFGSAKIARLCNEQEDQRRLAPGDVWKSGTITSILTNPIYTGHTAYKRRERIQGKYHRARAEDWILSDEANEEIAIIDWETWKSVQEKRAQRRKKYSSPCPGERKEQELKNKELLPLLDVLRCGVCGGKMTNGTGYNYWTVGKTGEKRTSRIPAYKCQNACQGVPHGTNSRFRASRIEPLVFSILAEAVGNLLKEENILETVKKIKTRKYEAKQRALLKERQELETLQKKCTVMEEHIPDAMTGTYPVSLKELTELISRNRRQIKEQEERVQKREEELAGTAGEGGARKREKPGHPSWEKIFLEADGAVKRVLVNTLVEQIEMTGAKAVIRFKTGKETLFPKL